VVTTRPVGRDRGNKLVELCLLVASYADCDYVAVADADADADAADADADDDADSRIHPPTHTHARTPALARMGVHILVRTHTHLYNIRQADKEHATKNKYVTSSERRCNSRYVLSTSPKLRSG
jgi:hypothetical protein